MLGLKLAHVMALPALWGKMSKWRGQAAPLRAEAELGTELHQAATKSKAERQRLSTEEYTARLLTIRADLENLAARAGPIHMDGESALLEKYAHGLTILASKAEQQPDVRTAAPDAQVPFLTLHRALLAVLLDSLCAHLRGTLTSGGPGCQCKPARARPLAPLQVAAPSFGTRVQPSSTYSRRALRKLPRWLQRAAGLDKRAADQGIAEITRMLCASAATGGAGEEGAARPRIVHMSDAVQVVCHRVLFSLASPCR
jgi:hypothetical protein